MAATTLTDRTLLRLFGDDVHGFLQGLVTADMTEVTATTPRWAALLSPQGKVLFDFILWGDGATRDGDVFIDCETSAAEALAKRLAMYRLRRAITIQPMDGSPAVHWSPAAPAELSADATFGVVPDPRLALLGYRWFGRPDEPATGWHAHRLSLGVTEGAAELGSDATLWLECNAAELNGVSFTKGCYVGQENTARMHHRSKVNRRLVVTAGEPGPRTRIAYPALGLAVEHRRVDDLGGALVPAWLAPALGRDVP